MPAPRCRSGHNPHAETGLAGSNLRSPICTVTRSVGAFTRRNRDPGPHPRQPSTPTKPAGVKMGTTVTSGLSTPTERYFLRRGRGKAVVDEALGESFSGVLVSDFYAAYHHYDGPKGAGPTCCGTSTTWDPKDTALAQWAAAVHQLYVEARSFTHPQAQRRRTAQLAWERQLLVIGQPFLADPLALQGRLCRRIERHIQELFVFVAEPDVPSDNNPAERSLRHLVVSRKVIGTWYREQDDAGIHLRHLARTRPEPPRRLPPTAHFPSNLNSYIYVITRRYTPCFTASTPVFLGNSGKRSGPMPAPRSVGHNPHQKTGWV